MLWNNFERLENNSEEIWIRSGNWFFLFLCTQRKRRRRWAEKGATSRIEAAGNRARRNLEGFFRPEVPRGWAQSGRLDQPASYLRQDSVFVNEIGPGIIPGGLR